MEKSIINLFRKVFNSDIESIEPISAHGSSREYFRCKSKNFSCLAAYNENYQENIAFIDYSNQLIAKGINVPKIYGIDLDNYIYILEDLKNISLYDIIIKYNNGDIDFKELNDYYKQVIKELLKIQIIGGKDFDYSKAYPTQQFNSRAINWDLNYFKYYFLRLSGIIFNENDLENDFEVFVNYILDVDSKYFLFRDFQSRNIMIFNDKPYFIDYQGGRKGWLHYDLASILYDAKAKLSPKFRQDMLNLYIKELEVYASINIKDFCNKFYANVYLRIMQALGAYGYRGYFERKSHFLESIPYALENLIWLEENISLPIEIPYLRKIFKDMINSKIINEIHKPKLNIEIKSFSYKKGYPHDLSGNGGGFVFDCRAINNPGRLPGYKELTGRDKPIKEFLESEKDSESFFENTLSLVNQSINVYLKRGFTHLSVYYGCTGGQHRSVFFAEKLLEILSRNKDINVNIKHLEQSL